MLQYNPMGQELTQEDFKRFSTAPPRRDTFANDRAQKPGKDEIARELRSKYPDKSAAQAQIDIMTVEGQVGKLNSKGIRLASERKFDEAEKIGQQLIQAIMQTYGIDEAEAKKILGL